MDQINSDENRCFDEIFELADLEGMEFEELDLTPHYPEMGMTEDFDDNAVDGSIPLIVEDEGLQEIPLISEKQKQEDGLNLPCDTVTSFTISKCTKGRMTNTFPLETDQKSSETDKTNSSSLEVPCLYGLDGAESQELKAISHAVEQIEEIQRPSTSATVEHGKKKGRKKSEMTDEQKRQKRNEKARQYYHKRMEEPERDRMRKQTANYKAKARTSSKRWRDENREERNQKRRENPNERIKSLEYYHKVKDNPVYRQNATERTKNWRENPLNCEKLARLRAKKPSAERRTINKLYVRQWRLDHPEYARVWGAKPSTRARARMHSQKWRANPANKLKQQARQKRRMADPRYRENNKRRLKALYQRTKLLKEQGLIANQASRICIPENRLLRWLNIDQYLPFSKTGLSLKQHLRSIPLSNLIKSFPKFVSDTFLRKKKYWIYVLVAIHHTHLSMKMTLPEIEELIRSQANNENFIIYVYVGLNSNGMKANQYHASSKYSTPNKFHWKGYRVFEAHFIDCNIGRLNLTTATGDQLRQAVLNQEEVMKRTEAFIIRFGKLRNNRPFLGIQQRLMNKRNEPLTDEDATKADQLAQSGAEMFNFARNIKFPTENPGMIFAGGIPFRLISELKFAAKKIGF